MTSRPTRVWLPLAVVAIAAIALAPGAATANKNPAGKNTAGKNTAGNDTVAVTQETVNGKQEEVLTDNQGMTLYYSTKDTASESTCTAACAQTWRPLTTTNGKPSGPDKVHSDLSTLKTPSGELQVEYKGHPLYTYVLDQKPGDVKGAGKASFEVATVSTKANSGASSTTSSGSSTSGSSSGGSSSGSTSNGSGSQGSGSQGSGSQGSGSQGSGN